MPIQLWIFIAGLTASIVLGLIGWLLNRSISSVDTKIDATCAQVNDLRLEMTGYNKLVDYLSADVKELKGENKSLRASHAAFDKYIAVQEALHAQTKANA